MNREGIVGSEEEEVILEKSQNCRSDPRPEPPPGRADEDRDQKNQRQGSGV